MSARNIAYHSTEALRMAKNLRHSQQESIKTLSFKGHENPQIIRACLHVKQFYDPYVLCISYSR